MKSLFAPAAAALALGTLIPVAAMADETPRVISVMGEGRVSAVPDMASLSIGVRHEAATAREAMDLMTAANNLVIERLRAAGLTGGDIRTGGLGLDPVYRYPENAAPQVTSYAAYTNISVVIRDITQVGAVLDAAVSDGANALGGITFRLSDEAAALEEARRAAVADAHARAVLYAEAAGVTLGDVMRISEGDNDGGGIPVFAEMRMQASPAPMDVAAGEVEISARIAVVYAIAD